MMAIRFICCVFLCHILLACSQVENHSILSHQQSYFQQTGLFTDKDMIRAEDASSNVLLNYAAGGTIYGVFVNGLSGGSSCVGGAIYSLGNNAAGVVLTSFMFNPGQSTVIGQNLLYNMLNNALFYAHLLGYTHLKPGYAGSNTAWCFYLGVLSANTCQPCDTTGINLVTTAVPISITCDDETETCVYASGGTLTQNF